MAKEVDCVFGGCRFVAQHSEVKNLRTTQLAEGTQNWRSSYRPQKFIISKGTADDKISRKFETLQRKLHVSKKQYLGQNESDKCVTWVEITLWIYQGGTVQFLLIVQMDPCFCCHWGKKKKTSATSFLSTIHQELETRQSQELGQKPSLDPLQWWFHSHYLQKGTERDRTGLISHLPCVKITAQNKEYSSRWGLRFYKRQPRRSLSAVWQITLRGPQNATFQSWMKMNSKLWLMHYSLSLFSLSCQSTMCLSSRAKMKW